MTRQQLPLFFFLPPADTAGSFLPFSRVSQAGSAVGMAVVEVVAGPPVPVVTLVAFQLWRTSYRGIETHGLCGLELRDPSNDDPLSSVVMVVLSIHS
jgi:hypothetical protein